MDKHPLQILMEESDYNDVRHVSFSLPQRKAEYLIVKNSLGGVSVESYPYREDDIRTLDGQLHLFVGRTNIGSILEVVDTSHEVGDNKIFYAIEMRQKWEAIVHVMEN